MVLRTIVIGVAAVTLWENSVPDNHKVLLRYAARFTWKRCMDYVRVASEQAGK